MQVRFHCQLIYQVINICFAMVVIVPCVSVGNVPQLAIDLLIHTYGFKLVRSLDDVHLYPFAGPLDGVNSVPEHGISTACQLFQLGDISILQLRSPPLNGHKRAFLQSVVDVVGDSDVLVVGSANAGMQFSDFGHEKIKEFTSSTVPQLIPESGYFVDAFDYFKTATGVVLFTYEGDNIQSAKLLATELCQRLGLDEKAFVHPFSWKRVYGNSIPLGIEQGLYS